jgi:outer membrane protein assembly factor BamB
MKIAACLLSLLLLIASARSEEWPGWRGPRGDGTSAETGIPLHWGKDDNVAWKTPIPGLGHSSPVVWGDRIFLTTCLIEQHQRVLLCLDRKGGRVLWQRVVLTALLERKHQLNSYASSTPATDGKHVWVTFLAVPNIQCVCYDFDGNEVWRHSPGEFHSMHGFCSPPLLYRDLVLINGDQDGQGYLVALDRATGAERWRAERPNHTRSYCAPLLIDATGKKQLVLSGSKCIASYDPDTGKRWWILNGPTEQFVASLVYGDGVLFLTAGFPEYHNMGILPDGMGDITGTRSVLWHEKVNDRKAAYVPSPLAQGKYFFLVTDTGYAHCFEARTGKRLWVQRLGEHHSASPVAAEGRLYFPADDGTTFVLKAGPRFELLARNEIGEEVRASPAVSQGQFYLRTLHNLYCMGRPPGAGRTSDTGRK